MTLFCLFFLDSDGYTYSCRIFLGAYATQDDAETAQLLFSERPKAAPEHKDLANYEIQQYQLGDLPVEEWE